MTTSTRQTHYYKLTACIDIKNKAVMSQTHFKRAVKTPAAQFARKFYVNFCSTILTLNI